MTAPSFPAVAEIDRIAALSDPAWRNLLITQSYYELSAALARRLGAAANWCTFAVWASKQAGRTIRREDFAGLLERKLQHSPELAQALQEVAGAARHLGSKLDALGLQSVGKRILLAAAEAAMVRASAAVAQGNHKVFAEIARDFSRFLETFADGAPFDGERIARFVEALRPGDPPDGQGYLRRAFTRLYAAGFSTDARARAEQLFLANLEIGFHEQTRLQPEIAAALEAALPDGETLHRDLLHALFPGAGWLLRLRMRLPRRLRRMGLLDRALDRLGAALRPPLRQVVTEILLGLEHPGGRLRLTEDLARPFPDSLRTLADPELRELLGRLDPTLDSTAGSGAPDWADFPQRMHYVTDYFRCFHEEPLLLDPPFTAEQVAALKAGRMPSDRRL